MSGLFGLAVLAAGCGGSNGSDAAGSSSGTAMTQALAYTRCMRRHGVSDFPDPTTPRGGGVAFQIHGGPGSDLNRDNPTFKAANQACRGLLPGGGQPASLPAPEIAVEVRWARCMRLHGVPSFPDPNSQGAFDSAKFDEGSPAFQTGGKACKSLQPTGPTPVAPGQP
ncbi:MAG: hypothetical protein ACLP01_14205 [Solirubrobacteraceae bacterium]